MKPTSADTILNARRTTTFLASILVALCSGTNYVYSAYGPQLGSRLLLSHTKQNLIGMGGNVGASAAGPLVGILADSRGPRLSLALSFVLLLVAYLGTKVVYDGSEGNTEPAGGGTLFILILFGLFSGIGSVSGHTAGLNTVMKSFPDEIRSTMTGIVISGFGLSAFLFSTIARTFFPGNTSGFLLTLALGTPAPMALGWFLIRPCPYPDHVAREIPEDSDGEEEDDTGSTSDEIAPFIITQDSTKPPSITGLAMIRTVDFWVLFWFLSLLSGSGIMWINNLGLMARALALKGGASPGERENVKWQTLQVSSMSIASCIGRILIGVTADLVKRRGMRRTLCLSLVATSFFVSQLVGLRVREIEQLQYAVVLVGISYGALWGFIPIIVIEWFGIAHVSANTGLLGLSTLVMGSILPTIFGRVYDAHSSHGEDGMRCLEGAECYSASLYVTALATLCALGLAIVAAKRDQKYR